VLASIPPGKVFGRYRVVRVLGSGGMGTVYEARHVELDRRVALKALPRRFAENPTVLERFMREGKAVARIEHPHVVTISDVGTAEGVPYLVMEYLEGESLGALLAREKRLEVRRAVDLLLPIVSAIAAAHAAGIVHRDLKPDNVFLVRTPHGAPHPKLLDFGISKIDADLGVTETGVMLGTPKYMSPEQALNSKNVGAPTDQWSLGVILHECITGRRPFEAESLFELLQRITLADRPRMTEIVPDVPEELERVVDRAMAREPAHRYPSMAALGRALLPFASPETASTWAAAFEDEPPRVIPTASLKPDVDEEAKRRRGAELTVSVGVPDRSDAARSSDVETVADSPATVVLERARAPGGATIEEAPPASESPVTPAAAASVPNGHGRERRWSARWLAGVGIVGATAIALVAYKGVASEPAPAASEERVAVSAEAAASAAPSTAEGSASVERASTVPAAASIVVESVDAGAAPAPRSAPSATVRAVVRSSAEPTRRTTNPGPSPSSTTGRYEIE